jgi:hypothetical protein
VVVLLGLGAAAAVATGALDAVIDAAVDFAGAVRDFGPW